MRAGRWLLESGSEFELIGKTSGFPAQVAQQTKVSDDVLPMNSFHTTPTPNPAFVSSLRTTLTPNPNPNP